MVHGSRCVMRLPVLIIALAAIASFIRADAGHVRPLSGRMRDGKVWTLENLKVSIADAYCYNNSTIICDRHGRLYTFASAQRGCRSLGSGWRVPSDADWRRLAQSYGGVSEDSRDGGRAAYAALSGGGSSGFNASLGGGRIDGQYSRLDAHGFYWTSSMRASEGAWFYNFARGSEGLHRQSGGDPRMAASVRCVRD